MVYHRTGKPYVNVEFDSLGRVVQNKNITKHNNNEVHLSSKIVRKKKKRLVIDDDDDEEGYVR